MSRVLLRFALLALAVWPALARAQPSSASVTAITGAVVVDGTGAEPRAATVLIRGDRIEAVGQDVEAPAGAHVVRADGHTLLPGLFDLHTHMPYAAVSGLFGDWGKNLKAYLYCGVTSIVDFGVYPEMFEPARRLWKEGVFQGPRMSLAARITTPGGHGAEGGRGDFFTQEVLTPREARAAVRRILAYQPDVIKVFTDGWRYGFAPDMTSMEEDTLAAIVDEAHRKGIEVLTHTVTLEKAKIAACAGVDVIAHGIGNAAADLELVRLMKEKGTTYVPTLAVYEPRRDRELPRLLSEVLEPLARQFLAGLARQQPPGQRSERETPRQRRWRLLMENTAGLRAAGIAFATGTDAGVTGTYHGWSTLRELELLVEGGLTSLEALTAATGGAARALRVESDRGVIAPGRLADLVLVEGAPYKEIREIERVRRVFLGGKEVDRGALARDIASPLPTPIPARKPASLIADFEQDDGRSTLGTLVVNGTDSGHDNSRMLFARTVRDGADHALTVLGRMAEKDHPNVSVSVPLSPGAVEPVDARAYTGVRFDARGEGEYRLVVHTRGVRDTAWFQAPFQAGGRWATLTIPFSSLRRRDARLPAAWTGDDLLLLGFEASGAPGANRWLELDKIRFYQ